VFTLVVNSKTETNISAKAIKMGLYERMVAFLLSFSG